MVACSKSEVATPSEEKSYLIFGVFYGRCVEDCTTLFKVEEEKLYADAIFTRFTQEDTIIPFQTEMLSAVEYEIAKPLVTKFPMNLLEEEEQVIGMPNVVDQGTVLLEYSKGDITKRWYIDPNVNNLPAYLQSYISSISEITFELSQN
jgi:hypothetical protein